MTDPMELVDRLDYSASANRGLGRDGLVTLLTEAAACIREMVEVRKGMALVPVEPTNEMLKGACSSHSPGMSMGADRFGRVAGECPSFDRRRRIWPT